MITPTLMRRAFDCSDPQDAERLTREDSAGSTAWKTPKPKGKQFGVSQEFSKRAKKNRAREEFMRRMKA